MRRVINTFRMPAVHLLSDGRRRMNEVQSMEIFNEEIFVTQVFVYAVTFSLAHWLTLTGHFTTSFRARVKARTPPRGKDSSRT